MLIDAETTVEDVLLALRNLPQGGQSQTLYDIFAAIRGPDSSRVLAGLEAKNKYTSHIRATVFGGRFGTPITGWEEASGLRVAALRDARNADLTLAHYFTHLDMAFAALERTLPSRGGSTSSVSSAPNTARVIKIES